SSVNGTGRLSIPSTVKRSFAPSEAPVQPIQTPPRSWMIGVRADTKPPGLCSQRSSSSFQRTGSRLAATTRREDRSRAVTETPGRRTLGSRQRYLAGGGKRQRGGPRAGERRRGSDPKIGEEGTPYTLGLYRCGGKPAPRCSHMIARR